MVDITSTHSKLKNERQKLFTAKPMNLFPKLALELFNFFTDRPIDNKFSKILGNIEKGIHKLYLHICFICGFASTLYFIQ